MPFAVNADGTLMGPSGDSLKITNKSVFPIHMTKYKVTFAEGFNGLHPRELEDLISGTSPLVDEIFADENQERPNLFGMQLTIGGETAQVCQTVTNEFFPTSKSSWNMSYGGSDSDSLEIAMQHGFIRYVTKDPTTPQEACTIEWTVAVGEI